MLYTTLRLDLETDGVVSSSLVLTYRQEGAVHKLLILNRQDVLYTVGIDLEEHGTVHSALILD